MNCFLSREYYNAWLVYTHGLTKKIQSLYELHNVEVPAECRKIITLIMEHGKRRNDLNAENSRHHGLTRDLLINSWRYLADGMEYINNVFKELKQHVKQTEFSDSYKYERRKAKLEFYRSRGEYFLEKLSWEVEIDHLYEDMENVDTIISNTMFRRVTIEEYRAAKLLYKEVEAKIKDKILGEANACFNRYQQLMKAARNTMGPEGIIICLRYFDEQEKFNNEKDHFEWMIHFEFGIFMRDLFPCVKRMENILNVLQRANLREITDYNPY